MSGLASSRVRARERLPGLCAGRAWERFLREAGPCSGEAFLGMG